MSQETRDLIQRAAARRVKLLAAIRELRRHASGTDEQNRCFDLEQATEPAADIMEELAKLLDQVLQVVSGAWNPTALMGIGELLGVDRWASPWLDGLPTEEQLAKHAGFWLARKNGLLEVLGELAIQKLRHLRLDEGWETAPIDSDGDRIDMERTYGWKISATDV